jgi:hypothetical protein
MCGRNSSPRPHMQISFKLRTDAYALRLRKKARPTNPLDKSK